MMLIPPMQLLLEVCPSLKANVLKHLAVDLVNRKVKRNGSKAAKKRMQLKSHSKDPSLKRLMKQIRKNTLSLAS